MFILEKCSLAMSKTFNFELVGVNTENNIIGD